MSEFVGEIRVDVAVTRSAAGFSMSRVMSYRHNANMMPVIGSHTVKMMIHSPTLLHLN